MKSSITSRSLKLIRLATKVGREELAQNLREQVQTLASKGIDEIASGRLKTRLEQARAIAENLSQLKGAAMKAGQLLSLDASDYMPPEAVEILAKLQSKADPVEWPIMQKVLQEELGKKRISEFKNLSTSPAASASIGQVHRAQLEGRDVAIKIQYPGVRESIDSDLRILKTIAQSFVTVTGRKISLDELFDELSLVLHQEADYELELRNMEEFRRLLANEPDFLVPEPLPSHSASRVLTMTWQEGLPVTEWVKTHPSYQARELVGRRILDLYCKEFYEWGFVQTDPNYANFLVQDDPTRIVLLDFGASLRYSPEFRREYIELLKALSTLDRQKIVRTFVGFGLMDDRESEESKELFADLLINSLEPFQPGKQPFRFRDDEYAKRSREVGQKFSQSLKYSAPPRKILFLHRKLGGVFTMLKKLDVQLNLSPYWEKMVGTKL